MRRRRRGRKMGLFDKFKKSVIKSEVMQETIERISIFDTDYPLDKSNWFHVYYACLGKVMTIQNACAEKVVKGQGWNVDFSAGTLAFGKDSYPLQFIGSEAKSDNTWLWGWKNVNKFDDNLLKLSNEAKVVGESWGLEPLMVEKFLLDDRFNGHTMSIVVCGLAKENYCYYRGPHDGGAVFMAFNNVPDSVFAPVGVQKFSSTVMQCIQQFPVEHMIFIESYLMWNGTKYEWRGNQLIAHFEVDLCIDFEQSDGIWRIKSIKSI